MGDKSTLGDDKLHELAGLLGDDEEKATEIILKARMSIGRELGKVDLENVLTFAEKVQNMAGKAQILVMFSLPPLTILHTEYRRSLYAYLVSKMETVAPNLATLS